MSLPLIVCLIATVVPVFFGQLGSAPTWLSLQALALGWITLHPSRDLDLHTLGAGLEVLLIRAWLVPQLMRQLLRRHDHRHTDVMPSNLFAWGVAISLIILAFKFGGDAVSDERAMTLGVVAATVMIAFLVLATNDAPTAQLMGLLFMENALALFESLLAQPWPLPVHLGIGGLYLGTALVGRWLIKGLQTLPEPSVADTQELP